MSLVIAIDVGVKNLAICAWDFVQSKVVHWDNVSLVPMGRYIPAQNVHYVREFVRKHEHLFAQASTVLVERQMRCNMRIIEAVLQTLFYDRCIVIAPRSVKVHYGIGHRDYRRNKAAAVQWVQEFSSQNGGAFTPETLATFVRGKKQDDLADALLLILYYLDTYSNQRLVQ
jgi:hypothetical protein